jgi:hypothetical protein
LDKTTEFIITLEEKLFKSNKLNLELVKALQEAEFSMANFPMYLLDQDKMGNQTYKAVSKDPLDVMVGNYINVHPERRLLLPIISREAKGLY